MKRPDSLRLCTYNVRDLFLHGEGPPKPRKEVRPLARMINQVQADLLVLQEVGSEASLQALNDLLQSPYPHCAYSLGNSDRSIGLGVLSRYPLQALSHADKQLRDDDGDPMWAYADAAAAAAGRRQPLRLQRDVLLLHCRPGPGWELGIFATHLKSKTSKPWQLNASDEIRAAEVRLLASVVEGFASQHPRAQVVVMGDLNDLWSSDVFAPLRKLGLLDAVGTRLQVDGRNPSTYWPRRRTRVDHVLVLPRSAGDVAEAAIHANQMARTASDHYPVSIRLNCPAE